MDRLYSLDPNLSIRIKPLCDLMIDYAIRCRIPAAGRSWAAFRIRWALGDRVSAGFSRPHSGG